MIEKISGILGYGSIGWQIVRVCIVMGMFVYVYIFYFWDILELCCDYFYLFFGFGDVEGVLFCKWFFGGFKEEFYIFFGFDFDFFVVVFLFILKIEKFIFIVEFEVLKKKWMFFSNIGCGFIVDLEVLYYVFENEVICGVVLDVIDLELFLDGDKFWGVKNIIIIFYVSGRLYLYKDRLFVILKVNLEVLVEGKEFMNRVNWKDGYWC